MIGGIFGAMFGFTAATVASQRAEVAAQLQRDQWQKLMMQKLEFDRAYGEKSLSQLMKAPESLVRKGCNCRNCGAPFEAKETSCSYCKSER